MGLATIIRKHKFEEREVRLLILGLDNAGKSTCLSRWLSSANLHDSGNDIAGNGKSIAPTFGFEIKTVQCGPVNVVLWDIGGQRSLRAFWRNFFEDSSDGLVYVIDSQDTTRLQEALRLLVDQITLSQTVHLAIVANKLDLPGALSPADLQTALEDIGTKCFPRHVVWRLFAGSALDPGDQNIQSAFDWLVQQVSAKFSIGP
jgi:ADP-ribosylation factor-like protein 2